jgi:hypothetical protein
LLQAFYTLMKFYMPDLLEKQKELDFFQLFPCVHLYEHILIIDLLDRTFENFFRKQFFVSPEQLVKTGLHRKKFTTGLAELAAVMATY